MKNLRLKKSVNDVVFLMLGIMVLSLTLTSCKNEIGELEEHNISLPVDEDEAMNIFAQTLSNAIQDKDIRDFIKEEALKEIDDDYDVIYTYVKNKEMKNGMTFHENIKQYSHNHDVFEWVIDNNKLLTIYVPFLSGVFSAPKWNVDNQIPVIAVRNNKEEDLKVFGKQNCESLSRKIKPDFPVLVVKTNERLTDIDTQTKSLANGLSNEDGVFAYFLDDSFNKLNKIQTKATQTILRQSSSLNNPLLARAYVENKECVRDYIYYGIGPRSGNEGTLHTNNREQIVAFEFTDPSVLGHVNDSFDPTGDWSDGNLELNFDFLFIDGNKNIQTLSKMRSVKINELFNISTGSTKTLKYILPEPIEIFNWDLYTYGNMYKISVSEYDPGTVIEKLVSHTSVFGQNFEANAGGSIGIVKVGAKYSTSQTETKQSSTKVQSTNNSDPLGDVIINFFDPIYLNNKIDVDIAAAISPWEKPGEIAYSKNYIFNTSNDLWSYIQRIERGEIKEYADFKFCIIYDNNIYGDTYMSNTGMIKLKIEPVSLVK